ncbi:MAG TPA: nucleoside transporter C-terminal domain-containing protein [Bacteroidales bacterium]|nr:nucleoside transporter C-terminal domain-containing protein [Bacteroidales bacterium]
MTRSRGLLLVILILLFLFSLRPLQAASPSPVLASQAENSTLTIGILLRTISGILLLLFLSWLLSSGKKQIRWNLVISGLVLQFLIALAVLYLPPVQWVFEIVGKIFIKIIDFSAEGSRFVFGNLSDQSKFGVIFAFQVLPTIIFFAALMSLLFHLGIIQRIVRFLGWLLSRSMQISGEEGLAVAGNIFLGQNEAPLLIRTYLDNLNKAALFLVMTSGMATIAGGVMAAYIGFLGGSDPVMRLFFAKHLLAASVMAAPGAVVIARIMVPAPPRATEPTKVSSVWEANNPLDAIAKGTMDGLRLAASVAAMLIVFVAFIALINFILLKTGQWSGLNKLIAASSEGLYENLSLQYLLGKIFQPVMWLLGINPHDASLAGSLLGQKIIMTEFIGYLDLMRLKEAGAFLEQKTIVMATYFLCGFANFASVGIQIGGIGTIAPSQRIPLSRFGLKAMIAGTITSLLSAAMIGLII